MQLDRASSWLKGNQQIEDYTENTRLQSYAGEYTYRLAASHRRKRECNSSCSLTSNHITSSLLLKKLHVWSYFYKRKRRSVRGSICHPTFWVTIKHEVTQGKYNWTCSWENVRIPLFILSSSTATISSHNSDSPLTHTLRCASYYRNDSITKRSAA